MLKSRTNIEKKQWLMWFIYPILSIICYSLKQNIILPFCSLNLFSELKWIGYFLSQELHALNKKSVNAYKFVLENYQYQGKTEQLQHRIEVIVIPCDNCHENHKYPNQCKLIQNSKHYVRNVGSITVPRFKPLYHLLPMYTGVRCVWWEGEGGGSHFRSPLSKSHLLILSWREGAQPIINDRETILVVHKFNTRGLAIKLSN